MTRLAAPSLALSVALVLAAAPGIAQSAPPEGALPLSRILATVEATEGVRFIREAEWDSDGYWEVEYHTTDGRRVEIRVDPMTGAVRR